MMQELNNANNLWTILSNAEKTVEKPEEEKPAPYTAEDAAKYNQQQKKIGEDREKKAMELEQELKTKLGDNYGWYMDKLMASVNK